MKNKNKKLKELFSINKVITLLKFKSVVNICSVSNWRRIEKANSIAIQGRN